MTTPPSTPPPTSNELAQQRTDMVSVRTHQAVRRPGSGDPPHVAAPALGPVVFLIYGLLAMVAF